MSNDIYNYLIKKELKVTNPIKYQELIVNGGIDAYLEYKEIEIKDMLNIIEKQLREKFISPKTNNYFEMIKYENMIRYMAIEITKDEIKL